MKPILLFIFSAMFCFHSSAQVEEQEDYLQQPMPAPENNFAAAGRPLQTFNSKGTNIVSYIYGMGIGESHELRVDHFFHEKWSLFYSARYEGPSALLPGNSSETQLTAPIGLSVGTIMAFGIGAGACGGYYGNGLGELMIASLMIPDGIAYHHYLADNLDFSPYINVSGLSFISNDERSSIYYTPSAGGRLMYSPSEHFIVSGEYRVQYSTLTEFRTNLGIGVSVRF